MAKAGAKTFAQKKNGKKGSHWKIAGKDLEIVDGTATTTRRRKTTTTRMKSAAFNKSKFKASKIKHSHS